MAVLLGCIADDFTGATDLASMLVRHGMATVQLIGVPEEGIHAGDAQAVVVALKSRTIPAAEAIVTPSHSSGRLARAVRRGRRAAASPALPSPRPPARRQGG